MHFIKDMTNEVEMDNKPEFWDFVRAYRYSDIKEDQLYIFDRKRGTRALYNKPPYKKRRKWNRIFLIILLGFYLSLTAPPLILSICGIIFWDGVFWDYFLVALILAIPFLILDFKFLYSRMDFEKISETGWDKAKEKEYRKANMKDGQKIGLVFSIISLCFYLTIGFFNSFTITYLRYVISGGPEANASVYIEIDLPGKDIRLNTDTLAGEVYQIIRHEGNIVAVYIDTEGIPEQVKLYINDKETDYSVGEKYEVFASNGGFAGDHYFDISIYGNIYFDLPEGQNTLELRSANFSKSWTFTLKYE